MAAIPPSRAVTGWQRAAAACCLVLAVALLFLTAERHEDFWWNDAATFALNGDLIRDYVASGLHGSPLAFAKAYYLRYPALTISLYPPLFPMAEAAVFAVFGFSHASAQATVAAFTALAVLGAYLTARTALPLLAAAAFALVLLAAPGVMLWSRQVMMETPSLAFLLLAAVSLLRYQAAGRPWQLYRAVAWLLAAIYTKQTAVFVAAAFPVALLLGEGWRVLRRRAIWIAAAAAIACLVPLAVFTLKFATQLIDTATRQGLGTAVDEPSRFSLAVLTVYGRALPDIVGWVPLAASVVFLGVVVVRGFRDVAERRLAVLMLAWFVADYLLVSFIGHFEARYGMTLAIPPAMFTVLLAMRLLPQPGDQVVALAGAAALFTASIATHPLPYLEGYGAVAAAILDNAAPDDVVMFDGDDSKSLSFSLRQRSTVPKVFLVRAEKPLLNYKFSMRRDLGITDANLTTADIDALIDRLGVTLVALQPDFWTDQPSMARFQEVVMSDRFKLITAIPVEAQEKSKRATIMLFRNQRPTKPAPGALQELLNGM